jgi:hypothetical protein
MTEMWLKDLGPYAMLVLFAAYIILKDAGIIKSRGNDRRKNSGELNGAIKKIDNIEKKTDDLYKWHDQRDSDGAFAWYVRKSLEKSIDRLADNIEAQTEVMRSLVVIVKQTDTDVKEIKGNME